MLALLEVKKLKTYFRTRSGVVRAVDGVSFAIPEGRVVGLVGESGCGKTTTGRSIIRVLPPNGYIAGGEIYFKGVDLVKLSEDEMRQLRWRDIAVVPQSAMDSLDPVYRVGQQLEEILVHRGGLARRQARRRAEELFALVGLDPHRLRAFPHELSGGMKQRAMIAMALALNPSLVIADEPVTALDVIVQDRVLRTFKKLQQELNIAVVLITHDMGVVAETCDWVIVMYAGRVVEAGPVRKVLQYPCHPYTMGLKNAFPKLRGASDRLVSIPGHPPDLRFASSGCRFADRCPFAVARCREGEPSLRPVDGQSPLGEHVVACVRSSEAAYMRQRAGEVETWQLQATS